MWQALIDHFRRYPAQEKIVRLMITYGLRIEGPIVDDGRESKGEGYGKVFCGNVELGDTAIGRAAGVDRRIVRSTVETILQDPVLKRVFTKFSPTLQLKDVAPDLECGLIEIIPSDPTTPGILAGVSSVIAGARLSIRQAVVEDPFFTEHAKLYVVTESRVPPHLIPMLQAVPGVKGVAVY